ncbi:hypothetical protein Bbelb_340930 [Branchiostoma belcheri]|nr:hypothetical protein Bbelb_340930 [Branchiostoma belcheri]
MRGGRGLRETQNWANQETAEDHQTPSSISLLRRLDVAGQVAGIGSRWGKHGTQKPVKWRGSRGEIFNAFPVLGVTRCRLYVPASPIPLPDPLPEVQAAYIPCYPALSQSSSSQFSFAHPSGLKRRGTAGPDAACELQDAAGPDHISTSQYLNTSICLKIRANS